MSFTSLTSRPVVQASMRPSHFEPRQSRVPVTVNRALFPHAQPLPQQPPVAQHVLQRRQPSDSTMISEHSAPKPVIDDSVRKNVKSKSPRFQNLGKTVGDTKAINLSIAHRAQAAEAFGSIPAIPKVAYKQTPFTLQQVAARNVKAANHFAQSLVAKLLSNEATMEERASAAVAKNDPTGKYGASLSSEVAQARAFMNNEAAARDEA